MERDNGLLPKEKPELKKRIVGLILAAGYSSRMGVFKPLLPIGDVTALELVCRTFRAAGIETVICVTGLQRERLRSILDGEGAAEAYNPNYDQGMFRSIQTGVRGALSGREPSDPEDAGQRKAPEGFLLLPVDCPLVSPEVIRQILCKHEETPEAFIVPCYQGKKGHPLLIPARYAAEILSYEGEGGLKAVTNRHEEQLVRLEVSEESVLLDMDTPEGYQEVLAYYESRSRQTASAINGFRYEGELAGKRLFLIRHGETQQHQEKIFLGQTDVLLSDRGRIQAAKTGEELCRYGISTRRIYTSDLSRAMETAEILRNCFLHCFKGIEGEPGAGETVYGMEVIPVPNLRELSLGEWDGRYIREIRERYPEEYRKRGEQLLTYKFGNDSENYYDLRYRALKGLREVCERERKAADSCSDIMIVAHSGVINVLLSALKHQDLEERIKIRIPTGGIEILDFHKATSKTVF